MIKVEISQEGVIVAECTYQPGLHVIVDVNESYREKDISFKVAHSQNPDLTGKWEDALDKYFNEGNFDYRENRFPGELARSGLGRDHKTLFSQAAHCLLKELEPHGYSLQVKFE